MQERFVRTAEVAKILGCCETQVRNIVRAGQFPKPVKVFGKRASAWPLSEIQAYMKARVAERDAAAGR